jgi:hypothetical protein
MEKRIRLKHIEPSGGEPQKAAEVDTTHWYTTVVNRHPNPFLSSKFLNISVQRVEYTQESDAIKYDIRERTLSESRASIVHSGTIHMDLDVRDHLEQVVNNRYNGNWLKRLMLRNEE